MVLIGCNQQSRRLLLIQKLLMIIYVFSRMNLKIMEKDHFSSSFAKIDFSKEYRSEYEKSYSKTDLPIK